MTTNNENCTRKMGHKQFFTSPRRLIVDRNEIILPVCLIHYDDSLEDRAREFRERSFREKTQALHIEKANFAKSEIMFPRVNNLSKESCEQRIPIKSPNISVTTDQHSDSEDENNERHDHEHQDRLNNNETQQSAWSKYCQAEDRKRLKLDESEDTNISPPSVVCHNLSDDGSKRWSLIKIGVRFLGVWIYWILVQCLVFEKWILSRSPSKTVRTSEVFVPASSYARQATRRRLKNNFFPKVLSGARKQISWRIIFSFLLIGLLVLLILHSIDFEEMCNNIRNEIQEIKQVWKNRNVQAHTSNSDVKSWPNVNEKLENFTEEPKSIPLDLEFSELKNKFNIRIHEELVRLEQVFEERLAAIVDKHFQSVPVPLHQPINGNTLNELRRDVSSYVTDLRNNIGYSNIVCAPCMKSVPTCDKCENSDVGMVVTAAINKYDADKTGKLDLALESSGGSIVSTRSTISSNNAGSILSNWFFSIWYPLNNPNKAIQPGTMPGDCWSFDGTKGFLVIQLGGPTQVTGFALEHLPKIISPVGHIKSAPKRFQVVGHLDYENPSSQSFLGEYEYLDNEISLQYFEVQSPVRNFYKYVELKILSNHGSIEFTCLYRFRVFGNLVTAKKFRI